MRPRGDADRPVVAQLDADLSHPPERLPALFAALDTADVAVGSRYVDGGGVRNWPWRRRLLSWGGNRYVRAVLGTGVRDNTAGYKAFRRSALEEIGERPSYLHAQTPLVGWYTRHGYVVDGDEYVEDGIPHTPMSRP